MIGVNRRLEGLEARLRVKEPDKIEVDWLEPGETPEPEEPGVKYIYWDDFEDEED